MTTPLPEDQRDVVTSVKILKDDEYISPGDPGYDHQVLKVSRQITYVTTIPITSYPGMNVSQAVEFEHESDLASVVEGLMWVEEGKPGQSVELRTHVDVVKMPTTTGKEN